MSSVLIPVRKEHMFPLNSIQTYLDAFFLKSTVSSMSIMQFNGGQSNPTFYLSYNNEEYVLRKKPPGKILLGAHAIDREYKIICALRKKGFPVPEPILYCEDTNVIGTEFYITRFLNGRIFRDPNLPGLNPLERTAIYKEMVKVLAELHSFKVKDLGLQNLAKTEKNYYGRQISTWTKQYKASETSVINEMEELINWLPNNIPQNSEELSCLTHGDYRIDNLMFHPTEPKIIAVLDWELATIGHPFADLAYNCICFYLPKTDYFPCVGKIDACYGILNPKQIVKEYCSWIRIDSDIVFGPNQNYWNFYLSFSLFRLAGISQGVYKRFLQGNASSTNAKNFDRVTRRVAETSWKITGQKKEKLIEEPSVQTLFEFSEKCLEIKQKLLQFMEDYVYPNERVYHSQISKDPATRWKVIPPIMEELKIKAKEQGLWNLFLPSESPYLSVFEYASLCEIIGRSIIAPEVFNCGAPDTGNMEVLHLYGTAEQKEKWLKPLLNGEIRSCYAMTEPRVASSDATNIDCAIEKDPKDPSYYIVNGRKWWISGAGDPRCKIAIVMGRTANPKKSFHSQHSMILVPFDAPGVIRVRPLTVLGYDDAPVGHWELIFDNVRVPASNLLLGEGRGFEIAQGRLGPGRIHHCMRLIGLAQRSLELMCMRASSRTAFRKLLAEQGKVLSDIAKSKVEIEQARLLTLYAAKCIDKFGAKNARKQIAMIKVVAPNMAINVIERSIQVHGGGGLSDDFILATAFSYARTLRIADGPDDVHEMSVAKMELENYLRPKI